MGQSLCSHGTCTECASDAHATISQEDLIRHITSNVGDAVSARLRQTEIRQEELLQRTSERLRQTEIKQRERLKRTTEEAFKNQKIALDSVSEAMMVRIKIALSAGHATPPSNEIMHERQGLEVGVPDTTNTQALPRRWRE